MSSNHFGVKKEEEVYNFPFHRDPAVELSSLMGHLREHNPVANVRLPSGQLVWLVTRYDDVRMVLSDRRFSMAAAAAHDAPEFSPMVKMYPGLFSLDPPLHTKVRRLFTGALHTVPTATLLDMILRPVNELVEGFNWKAKPVDLIADFCEPMVTRFAATLLGVAADTIEAFRRHFIAMIALTGTSTQDATREAQEISDLVSEIVRNKREKPADDVFSHIVTAFDADGSLPDRNLVGLGASVLSSMSNSPITQISYAIVALLRHPEQWQLLVRNPDFLDGAVEECFRWSAPLEVEHLRMATEDVVIGGRQISRGSPVMTSVASANRDTSRFPDAATFKITRKDNCHLGFGHGQHVCAGSQIGTLMLRSVLDSLVRHLPKLRLAVEDTELFLKDKYSHALAVGTVPVTW
ncbi:cytochrome P450 [Lentzea sp. NEAU-D7]|uniref:cytochrome P450 n=1 Tax=Lentzea sp. NEAU-D7 TaxID=2994667 RepID=UPI00224B431F|nr:cytochrome P450 [Lentzea sp. NEAU-D7]MCX2954529.1 cytochrome P450 [Lentzea sp. NEAU-D7]